LQCLSDCVKKNIKKSKKEKIYKEKGRKYIEKIRKLIKKKT